MVLTKVVCNRTFEQDFVERSYVISVESVRPCEYMNLEITQHKLVVTLFLVIYLKIQLENTLKLQLENTLKLRLVITFI